MNTENIFEQASRQKLRFETPKTSYTVEDLWQMPLTKPDGTGLNEIAVALHKKINGADEISFINKKGKTSPEAAKDKLRFEIATYIIKVRETEAEQKEQQAALESQKQLLKQLIEQKESEKLAGTSLEELKAKLAALEAQ